MQIPKMYRIKQQFNSDHIEKIEDEVRAQFLSSGIQIKHGARIAITAGSRGIANIHRIVKTTVECVKESGGIPFIVPAMGSHGGATAEGQKEVLETYGITEKYVCAPIVSSMEVVELPQGNSAAKVYMDKNAYEADGTIIINRIKVHTDFHAPVESGLMKMCVIGIGKHKQAMAIHRHGVSGLQKLIIPAARQVLQYGKIILGIGIVENAYDETAIIRAIKPEEIETEEKKLIQISRSNMPGIPIAHFDILILDEMGKNISGTGMDTNIIGRICIPGSQDPEFPKITKIIVDDLTDVSHGNALGMGLADFITRKIADKIDYRTTYENTITSTFTERAKMPIVAENPHQAMSYALRTCGPVEQSDIKIVRIRNTLNLDEMYISKTLLPDVQNNKSITLTGDASDLFNDKGELSPF
jgi:hypothetical protein